MRYWTSTVMLPGGCTVGGTEDTDIREGGMGSTGGDGIGEE